MRSQRLLIALGTLALIFAVGLLSGTAGFVRSEQSAEAALLSEVTKLLASDAEAEDNFGYSVAVSGDTAVVGAYLEDTGGDRAGAAYIFQRDEGGTDNWGEVKKLTASDAQAEVWFGVSVAVSGDTAVVGAYGEDAGGNNAGAAYVFQRDEGGTDNWGEVKKLTASDAQSLDLFGVSVAVSGNTAVVGARKEDAGGSQAGAAYVFQRDEGGAGNWGEVKKLLASDAQAGDNFGISAAVSGDTAVVGADGEDAGGSDAGAAYLFQRDEGGTGNWGEVKKLTASDAEATDQFGISVAVSGDIAVVGALGASATYVFGRDKGGAGNWGEAKKLTASDAQDGGQFGISVAVSGASAVVGAPHRRSASFGVNVGAAYVFGRDEGGTDDWGEVEILTASDGLPGDHFGSSMAVSGDTAVVGAYLEDTGGNRAGAAYVVEEPLPAPTPTPCPTGKVPADGGCGTPTPTPTSCPPSKVPADSGCGTPTPTPVTGAMEVDCDASAAGVQSDCYYAPGARFQVEVHVTKPPAGGYLLIQAKLEWTEGVVNYLPTSSPAEEALWPECTIAARVNNWEAFGVPSVFSGCAPLPSLPAGDSFTGAVFTFEFQCQGAPDAGSPPAGLPPNESILGLISSVNEPDPSQGGTIFVTTGSQSIAPALAGATVTCAELLEPGTDGNEDPDQDGCTTDAEAGAIAAQGGGRDPLYYWDFMDMWVNKQKDRRVNVIDIGVIVQRFGAVGDANGDPLDPPEALTGYHVSADRSPPIGVNLWNAGPPDGSINIIDIAAAVVQFGHTCA